MTAEMTANEFDEIAKRIPKRIKAENIEIARLVMVDGLRQSDVADQYQVTKQQVQRHVKRFRREALAVPSSWVTVNGYFPPKIAERLAVYAEELKAASDEDIDDLIKRLDS